MFFSTSLLRRFILVSFGSGLGPSIGLYSAGNGVGTEFGGLRLDAKDNTRKRCLGHELSFVSRGKDDAKLMRYEGSRST